MVSFEVEKFMSRPQQAVIDSVCPIPLTTSYGRVWTSQLIGFPSRRTALVGEFGVDEGACERRGKL
jgi:hypothetical protein